jgi:hypothetical protein
VSGGLSTADYLAIVERCRVESDARGEDADMRVGRIVLACAEAAYQRGLEVGVAEANKARREDAAAYQRGLEDAARTEISWQHRAEVYEAALKNIVESAPDVRRDFALSALARFK